MMKNPTIEFRVTFCAYESLMAQTRIPNSPRAKAALLLAPVFLAPIFLTTACSQAPSADTVADLQTRLAAAEARATAAEKHAKEADADAGIHYQQTLAADSQTQTGAQGSAGQPDGQFGQPMIDTAPIDTAPAAPPQIAPGALSN